MGKTIGGLMRQARDDMSLSQREAAKKVGVCTSYYNQIENDKKRITVKMMRKISTGLGISFRDIFNARPGTPPNEL